MFKENTTHFQALSPGFHSIHNCCDNFCSFFLSCNLPIFSFAARLYSIPKIPPKQYGKLLESSASRELNIDDFIKHLLMERTRVLFCVHCANFGGPFPAERVLALNLIPYHWHYLKSDGCWRVGDYYYGIFWVLGAHITATRRLNICSVQCWNMITDRDHISTQCKQQTWRKSKIIGTFKFTAALKYATLIHLWRISTDFCTTVVG